MTAVRLRPNPRWKAAGRTAVAPRVVSEAEHSAAVMLRHALGANPQARDGARGAVRGENRKRRVAAHPGASFVLRVGVEESFRWAGQVLRARRNRLGRNPRPRSAARARGTPRRRAGLFHWPRPERRCGTPALPA